MKRVWIAAVAVSFVLVMVGVSLSAVEPVVVGVGVAGNQEVVSEHILGVVGTKAGNQLSRQQIQDDIEIIYGLGFFSLVDVSVTPQGGGVYVEYQVSENPVIEEIRFTGNTVFTGDELMEVVFTRPGAVFNRVFFRHDLQRISEKYEKAGYVMVRVEDVGIEGGIIDVRILEPVVGEVIIQGNKKTKTEVIRREFKLQPGDLFNATVMRHSLNKLNNLGFFEDVNVGFEPTEDPGKVNIVLTVEEGKTARLAFSIGHGSSSGFTGGASYEESNFKGLGQRGSIGFETGDKEQYWLSYEEPYMDGTHYRWKAGVYKRNWEDLEDTDITGTYNQDKKGLYYGMGKKFRNDPTLSWFVNLDWNEVSYTFETTPVPIPDEFRAGRNISLTGTVTRNLLDEYLSYPKGEVQSLSVQQGNFEPEDGSGEMTYTKYWLEARYYWPLYHLFEDLIDREIGTEDNPVIFATRLRAGYSSGDLPWAEQFFVGGGSTLRGYKDEEFSGSEMVLCNLELRIPIQDTFSIVGFYDIGMASDSSAFSDTRSGYGFGVRVKTGIGNLRLDFANGEDENRTHFSFGEMF
ncbi:MAG: POTRA domain-containing protein [Thermovirgaceae bacterium]|nr:POTRA domain-containing protein [Thermovirgaceae bacterium]